MRNRIVTRFAISMLAFTVCLSCKGQIGDQIKKLSGGYVYRVDGSMSYILPDHIFHEGVYPNVIAYAFDEDYILVLQRPSKKHITTFLASDILTRFLVLYHAGEIKHLKPEDKEILINGYVKDSSFYSMLSNVLSPNNTVEDIEKTNEIAERLLTENPYYSSLLENELNYWIIDHSSGMKLGPMSEEEFENQSSRLEISESLKVEFRDSIN